MNICEKLKDIRPEGNVVCDIFNGRQVISRKERLKKYNYYNLPSELWLDISIDEAQQILENSFCFHLESEREILEKELVTPLIKGFLNALPKDAKIMTNYDGSFEPISNAFLDIAVIAELDGVVGIICIEEKQES